MIEASITGHAGRQREAQRVRPPWEFDGDELPAAAVRSAFRTFGAVLIRAALERDEVARARAELDAAFASPDMLDVQTMVTTDVLKRASLWSMVFKKQIVSALRTALGPDLYYQHDLDVQRNSYGQTGWKRHTGWHMDGGSEGSNAYIRAPEYRFAKCGIFLQDFDNGWGGGIRVKLKSHRRYFEPNAVKRGVFFGRRSLVRIASMLHLDVDTHEVPTRAGDFCFFDSRLLHSSVAPRRENIRSIGYETTPGIQGFWRDVPPAHTKYVIYWDACNAAMVDDFLRNSIKRAAAEPQGMQEQRTRPAAFTRVLATRYPQDFPPEFVATATKLQIGVATLGEAEAGFYKRKLQTMQLMHP